MSTFITATNAIYAIVSGDLNSAAGIVHAPEIEQAKKDFLEALRDEVICIWGIQSGKNVSHEVVPLGILLHPDISFNLQENKLDFPRREINAIEVFYHPSSEKIRRDEVYNASFPAEWTNLRIKNADFQAWRAKKETGAEKVILPSSRKKPNHVAVQVKNWALKQPRIPHSASKEVLNEIENALGIRPDGKTVRSGLAMARETMVAQK